MEIFSRQSVITLPNFLSGARLLLSIPIFFLLKNGDYCSAVYLIIVATVSDFLDGFLARRLASVSNLGTVLDPLADKFVAFSFVFGTYLSPTDYKPPLYLVLALLLKELLVVVGAAILLGKGRIPKPNFLGKLTTALLFFYFTLFILYLCNIPPLRGGFLNLLALIISVLIALTTVSYLLLFLKIRKEPWERELT